VKNITPYGVFVELSTGIGGMIHISDLSWLKRFNNPNEYTKVGKEIEVIILSIDKEGRKLQLGHKQIEEDPWNSLESVFTIGSIHEGTVTKRDEKGGVVQLPYGLEGYAPARHLMKEDEKMIMADEVANFMVIEFDRNDKRILLSHTRLWEQVKEEEKQIEVKEKKAEFEVTKKAVKNLQSKVEKSTLGDIGALADLKAKFDSSDAADAAEYSKIENHIMLSKSIYELDMKGRHIINEFNLKKSIGKKRNGSFIFNESIFARWRTIFLFQKLKLIFSAMMTRLFAFLSIKMKSRKCIRAFFFVRIKTC
jgi:small subunit ribosomal protein S1